MALKFIYGTILNGLTAVVGIDAAKKFDTRLRFHRSLNLKNPETLADKVAFIELHEQSVLASQCADKYAVRAYVKEKGYEDILVPLAGGPWSRVEDVELEKLPGCFVLKATHGCKMNYIVPNKTQLDRMHCYKEMKRWMRTNYGTYSLEPHYTKIPHRIYAEEYLGDMSALIDYKIHCLNGVPQFVMAVTDRKVNGDAPMQVTLNLFDMDWNPIFEMKRAGNEIPGDCKVAKPNHFDEMVEIAKRLSEDFKFVRVDLYEINDRIYFGELTFSPACCIFPYLTDQFIREMGKRLSL